MNSELARAALTLNRLQSENNAGASHDLAPAWKYFVYFQAG